MKTINLTKICHEIGGPENIPSWALNFAKEAIRISLQTASERAMISEDVTGCQDEDDYGEDKIHVVSGGFIRCEYWVEVDKNSILNVIKSVRKK